MNNIESSVEPNVIIFLVGTKWDLADKREVNYEEGEKFAEEYNLKFYETSALDDILQYTCIVWLNYSFLLFIRH